MLFYIFVSVLIFSHLQAMERVSDDNNNLAKRDGTSSSAQDDATTALLNKLSCKGIKMGVSEFNNLIEKGADLYHPDENGQTALHHVIFHAVSTGNSKLIEACLKNNVDWTAKHSDEIDSPYEICKRASHFTKVTGLPHGPKVFSIINNGMNNLTSHEQ